MRITASETRLRALRGGLGLGHDGRHGAVAGVPPLARVALLVGRKLSAVQIADEPGAGPARAVRATVDAAAHVERAAGPRGPGGQAHDALRGDRGGQLSFRREPLVALEDALLLGGGKLLGVVAAEPAVARSRPGLAAAGHRAEPACPAAIDLKPPRGGARDRVLDLVLHQLA